MVAKRAMQRMLAKRQKQLDRALSNTAGMYGDLGGIIGANLPELEKLELPALADETAEGDSDGEAVSS